MKKDIEINDGIKNLDSDISSKIFHEIMKQREKICQAFIAETGLRPSEVEQVIEFGRNGHEKAVFWSLRKKTRKHLGYAENIS